MFEEFRRETKFFLQNSETCIDKEKRNRFWRI